MREIKFRGKRVDNDEWVFGHLVNSGTDALGTEIWWICVNRYDFATVFGQDTCDDTFIWYRVDPKTVGQYTGLKDENGKEIYEGDIVAFACRHGDDVLRRIIYYDDGSFRLGDIYSSDGYNELNNVFDEAMNFEGTFRAGAICDVVGNIHDNPELLEEE